MVCGFAVMLLVVLAFVAGCGSQSSLNGVDNGLAVRDAGSVTVAAAADGSETVKTAKQSPVDSLWGDLWTLPNTIATETGEILSKEENVAAFLLAGGASIALHSSGADRNIADDIDGNQFFTDNWSDEGLTLVGGPGFHFGVTGLWYLFSADAGDELNKQRSWTMMKALSITSATTLGMKLIRNNDTPNGKPLAWPSGHTSSSFTVAAVLDEMYGPQVGVPAYIGAGLVGYRMMDSGDHWASDVVFGAVLGYIVGHHVASQDKDAGLLGFDVMPFSDYRNGEHVMGVNLFRRF